MTKISFAVIGYGHIGRKHAIMVSGYDESELVAIVDIDAAILEVSQQPYKVILIF